MNSISKSAFHPLSLDEIASALTDTMDQLVDDIRPSRGGMPLFQVLGGDGGDHFELLYGI